MSATTSPGETVEHIIDLLRTATRAVEDAERRCPQVRLQWEANNDARTIWFRIKRAITLIQVDYYNLASWVDDPNYRLKPELIQAFGDRGRDFILREYDQHHKFGLLIGSYSLLEESLRRICEALDPGFMGKPRDFAPVIQRILGSLGLERNKTLFDLVRALRNTIHNNTVFLPRDKKDQTIHWKGVTYSFQVGRRADIVSWKFLAEHIGDLSSAMADIVMTPAVSGLPPVRRVL